MPKIYLEHFEELKAMNPSFYFDYVVDNDKKLMHCFWADEIVRENYKIFGDVVVFDATYDSNQHSLIFAPFIGLNHHRKSITFGHDFLANEKEFFVWLFTKWMDAMFQGQPRMIITYQNLAMRAAIAIVVPKTFHRYCLWHIMQKVLDKLGAINRFNVKESFNHIVWNFEIVEEFE